MEDWADLPLQMSSAAFLFLALKRLCGDTGFEFVRKAYSISFPRSDFVVIHPSQTS